MTYVLKGAGYLNLEDWSERSAQHTRSGLSWQHCKLEWQEAASCLKRHARQPCCAETIKMHLQNEVLCFIAIVYQGMTLLLSKRREPGLGSLIIAFLRNITLCRATQTSAFQSVSARAKQKNKSKPRIKASGLFFSFHLSRGDCLFLLPVAKRTMTTHPMSVFINSLTSIVPRVLLWST